MNWIYRFGSFMSCFIFCQSWILLHYLNTAQQTMEKINQKSQIGILILFSNHLLACEMMPAGVMWPTSFNLMMFFFFNNHHEGLEMNDILFVCLFVCLLLSRVTFSCLSHCYRGVLCISCCYRILFFLFC